MTNNARDPFCISMNPVLAVERNRRTPGLKIAAERAFGDHTLGLGVKHIDGLRGPREIPVVRIGHGGSADVVIEGEAVSTYLVDPDGRRDGTCGDGVAAPQSPRLVRRHFP
jgi:hypothetical protein